jgi:hypothetical protein
VITAGRVTVGGPHPGAGSALRDAPGADRDRPRRPAARAPRARQPTAATDAVTENPATPASANAKKTTLPVMLATNTWPRTR